MDELVKKIPTLVEPLAKAIVESLPDTHSTNQALSKLQECVWWVQKSVEEKTAHQEAKKQ